MANLFRQNVAYDSFVLMFIYQYRLTSFIIGWVVLFIGFRCFSSFSAAYILIKHSFLFYRLTKNFFCDLNQHNLITNMGNYSKEN